MQLPRDPFGSIVYPGRVKKERTWPFLDDASLPTSLTNLSTGSSTLAFTTSASNSGFIQCNSVAGAAAGVGVSTNLWLPSTEAILFEVQGLYVTGSTTGFERVRIGLDNGTQGAYVELRSAPSKAFVNNGASSYDLNYNMPPSDSGNHRNVSLLLLQHYGQLYVLEDDQVVSNIDIGGQLVATGAAQAKVLVYATSGNNTSVRIQQLKLSAWYY